MNIMLLENRKSSLDEYTKFLQGHNHNVYPCISVYKAKEAWKDNADNIDCAILDLAMDSDGLDDPAASMGGFYTGWIFAKETILPNNPSFIHKILLLTGWSDEFKRDLGKEAEELGLKDEQIIRKDDLSHCINMLEYLKKIEKNIKGSRSQHGK